MARKKVSAAVDSEIMFLSDMKCCVHPDKKGDHIHHIDENNSNNSIENLALLCFDCHNMASIKGSLSKKLSPHTIKKFREHHYLVIKSKRENALKNISGGVIETLTQEDLIEATTTSILLIEISKIKNEYYEESRMDRSGILKKILAYKDQSNPRVLMSILSFLNRVVYETRAGLPSSMLFVIEDIINNYLFNLSSTTTSQQLFQLSNLALNVGRTIIYDTSIHSNNFKSMSIGYHIVHSIFNLAKADKNEEIKKMVFNLFEEMKSQLERPERNDLDSAEQMRVIHLNALKNNDLGYPPEIRNLIQQAQ